jgi:hypothetical protein
VFCGANGNGDCPERTSEVEWRFECPLDATDATYEECEGGYVRFYWQIGGEDETTVVYDDEGSLIAAENSDYRGYRCAFGQPGSLRGCRSCTVCQAFQSSAGGGGEGGGFPGTTDCAISGDGIVSLP